MAGVSENISLQEFCDTNREYRVLLDMWSEVNYPLTPSDISIKSYNKVIWNIHSKSVEMSVYGMIHKLKSHLHGRDIKKYSLKNDAAELCNEWDYELNEFGPEYYLPRSHEEVFWKCKEHGTYALTIDWRNRVNGRGCPLCNAGQSSYPEQLIYSYLHNKFTSTINRFKIENFEYDIYIPELKLAIEYDGYPWHLGKLGIHTAKKNIADRNGINLINIAEYKEGELDRVKESYIINNVNYYKPTYSYNNINEVIQQIRNYILVFYGIDTGDIDIHIENKAKTRSKKRVQEEHSIGQDKKWIEEWVEPSQRDLLIRASRAGAKEKFDLYCPNCGEYLGSRTPHVINSQFIGCRFCKFTGNIPVEHINKVREKWKKSNDSKKKKL